MWDFDLPIVRMRFSISATSLSEPSLLASSNYSFLRRTGSTFACSTSTLARAGAPIGSSDSVLTRVRFAARRAMRDIIMAATLDNTADATAEIVWERR
jgi:hypothetical protein